MTDQIRVDRMDESEVRAALRAVLDLHQPAPEDPGYCRACDRSVPCRTLVAVEGAGQ